MSESLKNLLDQQAASVAFQHPDVQAITRAGDRRIRRRAATMLAGVVAAVTFVTGAIVVASGQNKNDLDVVIGRWPAGSVSWATGSTIHVGTETVEVGHPVRAFVRTSAGFAVVDDADNAYSVTTAGVRQIGRLSATRPDNLDQTRLAADPHGTLVGWVAQDQAGHLVVKTFDQVSGRTRSYPAEGAQPPDHAMVFAIDDRTGYWRTPAGIHAVNLDTGADRLIHDITGDRALDFRIYSVENGVLALTPDAGKHILVGRSVADARQIREFADDGTGHTDPVQLSPSGTWLSFSVAGASEGSGGVDAVRPEVYDTATGARITLGLPGSPAVAMPNVWLDDTTLMLVVADDLQTPIASLYTCTFPEAACTFAVTIGPIGSGDTSAVMPDGRWYGP